MTTVPQEYFTYCRPYSPTESELVCYEWEGEEFQSRKAFGGISQTVSTLPSINDAKYYLLHKYFDDYAVEDNPVQWSERPSTVEKRNYNESHPSEEPVNLNLDECMRVSRDEEVENARVANPKTKLDLESSEASDPHLESTGFRNFYLKPELFQAIHDIGLEQPSAVQIESIPQAMTGVDVLCQGKPGSGKTAVFILSVLQQLEPLCGVISCVVLCHSRELSYQTTLAFNRYSKFLPEVKTVSIVGGIPLLQQKHMLQTEVPNIVVGTPGRINHLYSENILGLDGVKFFVVDECDQLLENIYMRRKIQNIFKNTPIEKQVMMFSATLPPRIQVTAKRFMKTPTEILRMTLT